MKDIYTYKGKQYRVIGETDDMTLRLINDFLYCESIGDYTTIDNRITNGVMFSWMIPI